MIARPPSSSAAIVSSFAEVQRGIQVPDRAADDGVGAGAGVGAQRLEHVHVDGGHRHPPIVDPAVVEPDDREARPVEPLPNGQALPAVRELEIVVIDEGASGEAGPPCTPASPAPDRESWP